MIRTIAPAALGIFATIATAASSMPPASEWEIGPWARGKNYSVNMPATPRTNEKGHLVVDFPRYGDGEWDAMTTGVHPLAGKKRVTVKYRIDAARGTRFVAVEEPDVPATVSLYFQRAGDNWKARGKYASYRWYQPAATVQQLKPGTHTISIDLDDRWTNVWGIPNTDEPRAYAAALSETARFGIAFGSLGKRSHGVAATGRARFTLLSVDID